MNFHQSIFGVGRPKFERAGSTVHIDHPQIAASEPEDQDLMLQSIFNGDRTWKEKGEHYVYEVIDQIFKYDDPLAQFNAIYAHKKQLVTLWERRDRDAFKDEAGNVVLFRLDRIKKVWLNSPKFPDRLILTFVSQKYIDISKNTASTLVDGDDEYLIDGDDEFLL